MPYLRKYNTLLVAGTTAIRIPIIKRAVVDFAVSADWTPAAGDVKIAIDNTAPANVTNLPTAVASGNGAFWEFILTAAELSSKQSVVTVVDAATKAIEDQSFIVETFGNASAMYQADISLPNLPANVTQLLGTAWLAPGTAGTPDVNTKLLGGTSQTGADVGGMVADTVADVDEIITTLGAAVGASLSADIAAVKAETAEIDAIVDLLPNAGALTNLDAAVSSRATPAQILTTALTEAYAADGAAPTLSQAIFQLLSALYEFSISGTTITCKKLDGSTAAMTFTLDDATNPTSRTRAT